MSRFDSHLVRVALAMVAAVVVGLAVGRPDSQSPAVFAVEPAPAVETAVPKVLVVHVSGEVAIAGLVEVPVDARVADAIAAAGGVTEAADLNRVNLAEPVVDGQLIRVPSWSAPDPRSADGEAGDPRIRINEADAAALETLPGVGPVLAGTIISHRTEFGPFVTVEDLLDVPGIGEQKLASLRDLVIVP